MQTFTLGQIVETPKGKGKIVGLEGKEVLVKVPPIGTGKYVFMCTDELKPDGELIAAPRGNAPQAAGD